MLKRQDWYQKLSSKRQFAVLFGTNCISWFVIHCLANTFIFDIPFSLPSELFYAVWMSFFMTMALNWPLTKSLLIRKENA